MGGQPSKPLPTPTSPGLLSSGTIIALAAPLLFGMGQAFFNRIWTARGLRSLSVPGPDAPLAPAPLLSPSALTRRAAGFPLGSSLWLSITRCKLGTSNTTTSKHHRRLSLCYLWKVHRVDVRVM